MTKINLSDEKLRELGFVEKDCIIHPSCVYEEDERYLGQLDDDGKHRNLFVLKLSDGFRFDKFIAVNYRKEAFVYISGFMAGGIEIYEDFDDYRFLFNESPEWVEEYKNIIKEITK